MAFRRFVFSFVALLTSVPLALAQGTYTQFDVPGAIRTIPWGVSSKGDIAGSYSDSEFVQHGFVLSGGVYTTIDYPGAVATVATSVNSSGQVVGFYEPYGNAPLLGFFMDSSGFTAVNYPGATQTEMGGINDAGEAVGSYGDAGGISGGFKWAGGTFIKLPVPAGAQAVFVFGVNNRGYVAAGENRTAGSRSFIVTPTGGFIPVTITNSQDVVAYDLNDSDAIVGIYENSANYLLGFLLKGRRVISISFPNAVQTDPVRINDSGEIAGVFTDNLGDLHGFTWTPPAAEGKK